MDAVSYIIELSNFISLLVIAGGIFGIYYKFRIYRSETFRIQSFSIYFLVTCVLDLIMMILLFRIYIMVQFGYDLRLANAFFCFTIRYITYSTASSPGWILVLISFDRYIKLAYPKKFMFVFTRKFQIISLVVIIVYNYSFYIIMMASSQYYITISTDPETNTSTTSVVCVMKNQLTIYWMDLLNSTIVPFIFMIALTVLMVRCIYQSRRRVVNGNNNISSNNSLASTNASQKIHSKDRKFTITSIALNIVFIAVSLPVTINNLVSTYVDEDPQVERVTTHLFRLLYFAYFASDFYTQLAVNVLFRNQFLKMFGLKSISNDTTTSTASRY